MLGMDYDLYKTFLFIYKFGTPTLYRPEDSSFKGWRVTITLWGYILLLMEVNLVFSNHPETRKEVLHFYDYSSRGYMLPILHAGDSMLQILIEPVLRFTDNNGFLNLPL